MDFYVGNHHLADARRFKRVFVSINVIRGRKKPIGDAETVIDCAGFTELLDHGEYRHAPEVYAAELFRIYQAGVCNFKAAVSQDYMCEAVMLARTGKTIAEHQRLTIERYDALVAELRRLFGGEIPFHVMPVLQGYAPADYVRHIAMYGDRLTPGMWVGVGSVCKRNGSPSSVLAVLRAIKGERPDILLHGFGLKITALSVYAIRKILHSADSMAWSWTARRKKLVYGVGHGGNHWLSAKEYVDRVDDMRRFDGATREQLVLV
jgi:hypothetical protein